MPWVSASRWKCIPLLATLCFLVWPSDTRSEDSKRHIVYLVTADDSDTTRRILESLRKRIPSSQIVPGLEARQVEGKQIYVAIGPVALSSLLSRAVDGVIVSIFSSSLAYRAVLSSAPSDFHVPTTAIYSDPSPLTQFRLITKLYKRSVTTGVLLNDNDALSVPMLQRFAAQTSIPLTIDSFALTSTMAFKNLNRKLNSLSEVSVILAIPEAAIFNSENLRDILITTYRNNQGLIGYSAAMVKAGALATTFSDIEDIASQIAELIDEYKISGKLPEPQYPKYFSTIINDDVARSLNIVVDDAVRSFSRKPTTMK